MQSYYRMVNPVAEPINYSSSPTACQKKGDLIQQWVTKPAWDFLTGYAFFYLSAAKWNLSDSVILDMAMTTAVPYATSRFIMPLCTKLFCRWEDIRTSNIVTSIAGTVFTAAVGATVAFLTEDNAEKLTKENNFIVASAGFLLGAAAENLSKCCFWKKKFSGQGEYSAARAFESSERDLRNVTLNIRK